MQLKAKQKLKGYYGNITERQFRKYYTEASRRPGDTGENMIGLLERRLDAVVYRAKFVPTVFAARQLVNHGHVKVNGKRVNIPSYTVKENDVIEVRGKARDMVLVLAAMESPERDTPDYVEVDRTNMKAKALRTPKLGDVPYAVRMEPNLVVEFYCANVRARNAMATAKHSPDRFRCADRFQIESGRRSNFLLEHDLSENRHPLFRIMLWRSKAQGKCRTSIERRSKSAYPQSDVGG